MEKMELQPVTENNLPAQISIRFPHSAKLIGLLAALERPETRADAKMQLLDMTTQMMPAGRPLYHRARFHPPIAQLVQECGKATMIKAVFMLVKDFAASLNVVRNLSEDQAIEVAHNLVAECGTFRLEDYTMMFAMAKRGSLIKIMDRIDMSMVGLMVAEYDKLSTAAGQIAQEEDFAATDGLGPTGRVSDGKSRMEVVGDKLDGLAEGLRMLRGEYLDYREETEKKL